MKRSLKYTAGELLPYINWIYFFHAWGMPPRFATIADVCSCASCKAAWRNTFADTDQAQAREAEQLHHDALQLLNEEAAHIEARALVAIFSAWSEGDDIVVRHTSTTNTFRLPLLRQQHHLPKKPCLCWADFVAPQDLQERKALTRGTEIGVFACSVADTWPTLHDDDPYRRMLAQTLADRLAEAATERMHEWVRKTLWGYAPNEQLQPKELFAEKYEGRRPAVGYPSLPDLSLNFLLDRLIDFSAIGVSLTESGMMIPHAAVSGLLFDHPAAHHFGIGKIGKDQLNDYAARRGFSEEEVERFLAANL